MPGAVTLQTGSGLGEIEILSPGGWHGGGACRVLDIYTRAGIIEGCTNIWLYFFTDFSAGNANL